MPLVDLESVKSYMKIEGETENTLINDLIAGTSKAIENYCDRAIEETTITDEILYGNGMKTIRLLHYPVTTVTSVEVEGEPISDFIVDKRRGILIREIGTWPQGYLNIAVNYTAGYNPVPDDIQLACKNLVQFYYKKDIADYSTTYMDGSLIRPEAFPNVVRILLDPYRKVD